jgi:hypothetical protein
MLNAGSTAKAAQCASVAYGSADFKISLWTKVYMNRLKNPGILYVMPIRQNKEIIRDTHTLLQGCCPHIIERFHVLCPYQSFTHWLLAIKAR